MVSPSGVDKILAAEKTTPEPEERWQGIFLAKLAESGNVSRAAKRAGISRARVYQLREESAAFAQAWDKAREIAVGLLEDEAWRRAREGVLEPVFQKGQQVGVVRKYSDTLLIFLLKAHKPAMYRESFDITSGGLPLLVLDK